MKICWAVSVELCWRTLLSSIFNFGQISKFQKGHYSQKKKIESDFPVDMHIYTLSPSFTTKFHEILLSDFRGVKLADKLFQ